jgi:hypothetical protein
LQHLVDTTAGRNGPDLWVLYREPYTVVPRNVSGVWKGTHGGAGWQVQHVPLIIAGPDVRGGVHSSFPASAVDIAPTMERLLGLPSIPRDGVALADAFMHPTPDELRAEMAVEPSRRADVDALQQQSAVDNPSHLRNAVLPPSLFQCFFPPNLSVPPQHVCRTTAATATNE